MGLRGVGVLEGRMDNQPSVRIYLFGAPRVETACGQRIHISSKKGLALLATLATADRLERSRTWLQQILWGSRGQKQAQSSLRRELSNLRAVFARFGLNILRSNQLVVGLVEEHVFIDARHNEARPMHRLFCEGLDLASEDEFEEWLRDARIHFEESLSASNQNHRASAQAASTNARTAQIEIKPASASPHEGGSEALAKAVDETLPRMLAGMRWLPIASADSDSAINESASRYQLTTKLLDESQPARVNFSLLELPGRIIRWTETRILETSKRTAFEAEISRIANCVGATFDTCEQRRFNPDEVDSFTTLADQNWRIRFHINQFTAESFAKARSLIDSAFARNPENSELLMLNANLELWQHWIERSGPETSAKLAPLIRAAMRADPADARGPLFQGILDTWHRRPSYAIQHLRRACDLDPTFAQAFVHLGAAHYLSGAPEAAIEPLEHALFLAPLDAKRFFAHGELGTAYWMLGRYEECLTIAQNIQATHPGYVLAHVLETASYSAMGCEIEARQARARLLDTKPDLYRSMLEWIPFTDDAWRVKLCNAVEFDLRAGSKSEIAKRG